MRTRSTITIAKHVENRNTASEVLCCRLSVAACHVQHSVQTMSFAREIQISSVVGRLGSNAMKLEVAVVKIICFQISFGSNQPRLADGLAVADDLGETKCFSGLSERICRVFESQITASKSS